MKRRIALFLLVPVLVASLCVSAYLYFDSPSRDTRMTRAGTVNADHDFQHDTESMPTDPRLATQTPRISSPVVRPQPAMRVQPTSGTIARFTTAPSSPQPISRPPIAVQSNQAQPSRLVPAMSIPAVARKQTATAKPIGARTSNSFAPSQPIASGFRQLATTRVRNTTNNPPTSFGPVPKPSLQGHSVGSFASTQSQAQPARPTRPFGGHAIGSNPIATSAKASTVQSRTQPTQPPTILERVVEDVPGSAVNVQAVVRAKYQVPSAAIESLAECLSLSTTEVETQINEEVLTVTSCEKVHVGISRFISTFLAGQVGYTPRSSQRERPQTVQVFGNRQHQVTQAAYETPFEPDVFGFSPSAQEVQVLLRANYDLPAEQADAFVKLLNTKTQMVLEAKLVAEEGEEPSSQLTVTTTRAGQIAVAQFVEALFDSMDQNDSDVSDVSEVAAETLDEDGAENIVPGEVIALPPSLPRPLPSVERSVDQNRNDFGDGSDEKN